MRGTRIYLRQDSSPVVVGVDERAVVDTLQLLPGDTFVGFPGYPFGRAIFVRQSEVVALTPVTIGGEDET